MHEAKATGTRIHAKWDPNTMKMVALNAISMEAIERNSVVRPMISLFGKDLRKSSSA